MIRDTPRRRLESIRHAAAWAAVAAVVVSLVGVLGLSGAKSEDRNGDGRTDAWQLFDAVGRLAEATIDIDFDGYPDVREFYDGGALVRRETDRDRDRHVDFIEEFIPSRGSRFTRDRERAPSNGVWTAGAQPRTRIELVRPIRVSPTPCRDAQVPEHQPRGIETPRGPPASA